MCVCVLCCFYTHVCAECDVLCGGVCVGFVLHVGDCVRALYMCAFCVMCCVMLRV